MFTTDGSTCLAICVNALDNSTGLGITSGVAPGSWPLSRAAFTPDWISVPMTIPRHSVNSSSVKESNFWVRTRSMKLMELLLLELLESIRAGIQRFQFHHRHAPQNQCRARRRARGKALAHSEIRGHPRNYRFEHENKRRPGGGRIALRPGHYRERQGRTQQSRYQYRPDNRRTPCDRS